MEPHAYRGVPSVKKAKAMQEKNEGRKSGIENRGTWNKLSEDGVYVRRLLLSYSLEILACFATEAVINVLPPMVAPSPMTVSPPRMVALA